MFLAAEHTSNIVAACERHGVSSGLVVAVLLIPLLSFIGLLFFGKRLPGQWAGVVGTLAAALSFLAVVGVFLQFRSNCESSNFVLVKLFDWIEVGSFNVNALLRVDALSLAMALFVTGIGSLIHLYSIGYMHGDERFSRFFVYLNLFLASMLLLVLGGNFLMTFIGWEGVGTCSYLLISFWFERDSAARAGKKAFVTNRVGDFGFLLATFLIGSKLISVGLTNVLDYDVVFSQASMTVLAASATAICLLLFLGAVGKSAQLPLYVWLPDAMEGPTPVSALIHAATMVTAGVYLMVRVSPILELSPVAQNTIAIIGAATALFAATAAVAQTDIKRVLAYSTVSQLGFMFLAIGCQAYVAALFMMIAHAFFKALLFLGSGSVIHGMDNEQDMAAMGGLRKYMPITYITFLIGWLAIAGVPPFAGFWSKDDVLHAAFTKSPALWAVGLFAALLTAYYMTRQVMLVWFGKERFHTNGDHKPHESGWLMTVPLIVLAVFSAFGGLLNLPFGPHRLESWLHELVPEAPTPAGSTLTLAIIATCVAFTGIVIGVLIWRRPEHRKLEPKLLAKAWFVDPFYAYLVDKPGRAFANFCAYVVDKRVIDGAVNGAGTATEFTGTHLRKWQSGYVRTYVFSMLVGLVLILGFGVWRVWA